MKAILSKIALLLAAASTASAALVSMKAAGTINFNGTSDATIPVGTPWTFELIYDTDAPDLDPDSSHGVYTSNGTPAALRYFRYGAGTYQVTLSTPADFGSFSNISISLSGGNGIDINLDAPSFFPQLAGKDVSFHANFTHFSQPPIFTSDALPSDPTLSLGSFDADADVTLIVSGGGPISSSLSSMTSLTFAVVPEPSSGVLVGVAAIALLVVKRLRIAQAAVTRYGPATGSMMSASARDKGACLPASRSVASSDRPGISTSIPTLLDL